MRRRFPRVGEPMPGSSSIWSSQRPRRPGETSRWPHTSVKFGDLGRVVRKRCDRRSATLRPSQPPNQEGPAVNPSPARLIAAAMLAGASLAAQATDVGVSVSIGEPFFYGRIDINNYPKPRPDLPGAGRDPACAGGRQYAPTYLRVPPGHAKDWRKHCGNTTPAAARCTSCRTTGTTTLMHSQYNEKHGKGNGKGHGKGNHGARVRSEYAVLLRNRSEVLSCG